MARQLNGGTRVNHGIICIISMEYVSMPKELGTAFHKMFPPVEMLAPTGVVHTVALVMMHRNDDRIPYSLFEAICTKDEYNQALSYVFG